MGFKDKEETVSESGNWNVADSYTKVKIMRPLALCDYYEDIATFGYESLIEELINYSSPPNDIIKFQALKRLVKELIKLIKNAKFALKQQGTRKKALLYLGQLKKILELLPKLITPKYNPRIGKKEPVMRDHKMFEDILEKVCDIKSLINEPLNKNHLIFTDKEEFDPRAFKDRKKDQMINQG